MKDKKAVKELKEQKKEERLQEKQAKRNKKKSSKGLTRWRFRRFFRILGWLLILGSVSFGVYKNFTAINERVVVEKETIKEKPYVISGIESFSSDFAWVYFNSPVESGKQLLRLEDLKKYMQTDLVEKNQGVKSKSKEAVNVENVEIWNVRSLNDENTMFEVLAVVEQIKDEESYETAFKFDVYTKGSTYVVVKNPVVSDMPSKSGYEQKRLQPKEALESRENEKIEEFLDVFFGVYPKATAKELMYYTKGQNLKAIEKNYEYAGLESLAVVRTEQGYQVSCYVYYQDLDSKVVFLNQFEMQLVKDKENELFIAEMR